MLHRVGEFEKVSFEQFYNAMKDEFDMHTEVRVDGVDQTFPALMNRNGDIVFEKSIRHLYDAIQLPKRATIGSAGYDFKAPFSFALAPGATIKIPTGIRVKIDEGWWLACLPRSGHGFKYRIQLDNTMGVIDSDYYYSDNEGHIFAKITNDGKEGKTLRIEAGDGFLQAIFIPYGVTYSDDATNVRNGGMGSTDAKK